MCQTGRKPWHQTPFRPSYSHSTHPEFTRDFSQPVCGEREASLSNGNTRPLLRFFIKRRIVLIAMQQSITEGFRPCCSLRQIIAENDRAPPQQLLRGRRDASRRTAWVFARRDQQSTRCSSCVDRKNSRTSWDPPPCTCASSISRKRYDSVERGLSVVGDAINSSLRRAREDAQRYPPPVPRRSCERARVRTDDGEHSEWSDVTQGPRQGYVLSPLP